MKSKKALGAVILGTTILLLVTNCAQNQMIKETRTENTEKIEALQNKLVILETLINEYLEQKYEVEKSIELHANGLIEYDEVLMSELELILLENKIGTLPYLGSEKARSILHTLEQKMNNLKEKQLISDEVLNQKRIYYAQIKLQLEINPEINLTELKSNIDSEIKRLDNLLKQELITKESYEKRLKDYNLILEKYGCVSSRKQDQ